MRKMEDFCYLKMQNMKKNERVWENWIRSGIFYSNESKWKKMSGELKNQKSKG